MQIKSKQKLNRKKFGKGPNPRYLIEKARWGHVEPDEYEWFKNFLQPFIDNPEKLISVPEHFVSSSINWPSVIKRIAEKQQLTVRETKAIQYLFNNKDKEPQISNLNETSSQFNDSQKVVTKQPEIININLSNVSQQAITNKQLQPIDINKTNWLNNSQKVVESNNANLINASQKAVVDKQREIDNILLKVKFKKPLTKEEWIKFKNYPKKETQVTSTNTTLSLATKAFNPKYVLHKAKHNESLTVAEWEFFESKDKRGLVVVSKPIKVSVSIKPPKLSKHLCWNFYLQANLGSVYGDRELQSALNTLLKTPQKQLTVEFCQSFIHLVQSRMKEKNNSYFENENNSDEEDENIKQAVVNRYNSITSKLKGIKLNKTYLIFQYHFRYKYPVFNMRLYEWAKKYFWDDFDSFWLQEKISKYFATLINKNRYFDSLPQRFRSKLNNFRVIQSPLLVNKFNSYRFFEIRRWRLHWMYGPDWYNRVNEHTKKLRLYIAKLRQYSLNYYESRANISLLNKAKLNRQLSWATKAWDTKFASKRIRKLDHLDLLAKNQKHVVKSLDQELNPNVSLLDMDLHYSTKMNRQENAVLEALANRLRKRHNKQSTYQALNIDFKSIFEAENVDRLAYAVMRRWSGFYEREFAWIEYVGGRPRSRFWKDKAALKKFNRIHKLFKVISNLYYEVTKAPLQIKELTLSKAKLYVKKFSASDKKYYRRLYRSLIKSYFWIKSYKRNRLNKNIISWSSNYINQLQFAYNKDSSLKFLKYAKPILNKVKELESLQNKYYDIVFEAEWWDRISLPLLSQLAKRFINYYDKKIQKLVSKYNQLKENLGLKQDKFNDIDINVINHNSKVSVAYYKALRGLDKAKRSEHLKSMGFKTKASALAYPQNAKKNQLYLLRSRQLFNALKFLGHNLKPKLLKKFLRKYKRLLSFKSLTTIYFLTKLRLNITNALQKKVLNAKVWKKVARGSELKKHNWLYTIFRYLRKNKNVSIDEANLKFPKKEVKKVKVKVHYSPMQKFVAQRIRWEMHTRFTKLNPRRYAPTYRKALIFKMLKKYSAWILKRLDDRFFNLTKLNQDKLFLYSRLRRRKRWKLRKELKTLRPYLFNWRRRFKKRMRRLRFWAKLYKKYRRIKWWKARKLYWKHKGLGKKLYKQLKLPNPISSRTNYFNYVDGMYSSYWVGRLIGTFTKRGMKRKVAVYIYKAFLSLKYELQAQPQKILLEILNRIKPLFKLEKFVVRRTQIKSYPNPTILLKRYMLVLLWLQSDMNRYYDSQSSIEPFTTRFTNKIMELLGKDRERSILFRNMHAYNKESVVNQNNLRFIWRKRRRKLRGKR